MKYKIITGKYETGTEAQKLLFANMLGADVQYKFDLYFHWYNVIHELGHCLLDLLNIRMDKVDEEFWVNRFAIAYWKQVDNGGKLTQLREMLYETISTMQNPVPKEWEYLDFFRSIWQSMWEMSEQQATALYGYFQFSCVIEAMKRKDDFVGLLMSVKDDIVQDIKLERYQGEIQAENAKKVLDIAIKNLRLMGINDLEIELAFVDDPAIQCCQF